MVGLSVGFPRLVGHHHYRFRCWGSCPVHPFQVEMALQLGQTRLQAPLQAQSEGRLQAGLEKSANYTENN